MNATASPDTKRTTALPVPSPSLKKTESTASFASSKSAYSESDESNYGPEPDGAPMQAQADIPEHSTPYLDQEPPTDPTPRAVSHGSQISEPYTSPLQDLSDTFASAMADLGLDGDDAPVEGLADVAVAYRDPSQDGGMPRTTSTLESLLPPPGERRSPAKTAAPALYMATPSRSAAAAATATVVPAPEAKPAAPAAPTPPPADTKNASADPPGPKIEVYGYTVWWPTSFDASSNVNWDSTSSTQRGMLFARAANDLMDRDSNLTKWMKLMRQVQPRAPEQLMEQVTAEQADRFIRAMTPVLDKDTSAVSNTTVTADMPLPTNIPYPGLAKSYKDHLHHPETPGIHASNSSSSLATPHTSRLDPGQAMRGAAGAAGAGWQKLQGAMPRVPSSTSILGTLGRRNSRRMRDSPSARPTTLAPPSAAPPTTTPAIGRTLQHRASHYDLGTPRAPTHYDPATVRSASRASDAPSEPRFGLGIPGLGARMSEESRQAAPALLAGSLNLAPKASPAFEASLGRMTDALPELDERTARAYLQKANGDDVKAIGDYLQDQSHGETQRRGIFSRTPRTR